MKKVFMTLSLLFCVSMVHAKHTLVFLSADNLTTGTVNSSLLDTSSITKQGNSFNIPNQLLQLDATNKIPSALLPVLPSTIVPTGLVANTTSYASYGLKVTTTSTANQFYISADGLDIQGAFAVNLSTVVDITKNGSGGLDTGSKQATKEYYLFAISDDTGSRVGCTVSLSSVNPTVPSWATKSRRIMAFKTDGSANLIPQKKDGRKIKYWTGQSILATNSPATSITRISLYSQVSTTCVSVHLRIVVDDSGGATQDDLRLTIRPAGSAWDTNTNDKMGDYILSLAKNRLSAWDITIDLMDDKAIEYNVQGANIDNLYIGIKDYEEAY